MFLVFEQTLLIQLHLSHTSIRKQIKMITSKNLVAEKRDFIIHLLKTISILNLFELFEQNSSFCSNFTRPIHTSIRKRTPGCAYVEHRAPRPAAPRLSVAVRGLQSHYIEVAQDPNVSTNPITITRIFSHWPMGFTL